MTEINPDNLDATQAATSPESRQSDSTPLDLPPPAVTGQGRRTDESIDPGSAAAIAAGVASNSSPSSMAASSPPSQPVTGTPGAPSVPADELLGTTYLNKYELVSVLGAGGMGVIYQGRQIFLDRIVAIKMLKNNLASVKARMRFHQEAKAASQLNHPGIVGIIDFGVDDQDRPYMVMEHVEGCTFSDLIRERVSLSVQDALPVFLEICDALSEAHHKGIVHRDLKPSNIMLVVAPDGKVHTKLLDFGIAKMLDIQDQTLQGMTKTGEALGTPLYMSPEQIQGTKVTYRSDLYSMGCMLYMCLTGTPPFVGENKLRTMEKHCTTAPLPLRQASRGKEFPPGIEPIVMRLLEKDPADRYNSVDEFKEALIDMAVANGYMRRPPGQPGAIGQLYMTGVIPEMPKTIVDMVPNSGTTQAFDGLYEGAGKTHSSDADLGRFSSAADTVSFGTALVRNRRQMVLMMLGLVVSSLMIISGIVAFSMQNSRGSASFSAPHSISKSSESSLAHSSGNEAGKFLSDNYSFETGVDESKLTADQMIAKRMREISGLREIDLTARSGLTESGLRTLLQTKSLRVLDLSKTKVESSWLVGLPETRLLKLRLDDNPRIVDWSVYWIAKQHNLQHLSLANTGITDNGLRYLAGDNSLVALFLGRNAMISDRGIKNLNLARSNIEVLYLDGCNIGATGVSDLLAAPRLVSLNLADNQKITDSEIEIVCQKGEKLQRLFLADTGISETCVHNLTKLKFLEVLDLSGVVLGESALRDLGTMKSLKTLILADCGLSVSKFERLESELPSTIISRNVRPNYAADF
ncbi:MAG: protein kinase [Cyanobacteria bacterium SZAS TMP-1]|nr:protein kinase [Cyanobacteria bacterium SZAS TMP-1]